MADAAPAEAHTTALPPVPPAAVPRRTMIHVSDVALPVSIALWAFGVSQTKATSLGPFGLPAQLPIVFYAGIVLLVLSAMVELAIEDSSQLRMGLHAVVLVIMLYGTAALVYPEGRYSWLYKTVGVVQYVNAHGQLNSSIDIYQNWPGFFALAAWFDKVAGVSSPLAYAKWAQVVFELAALPLLYLIYDGLTLTYRQRWMALLLYPAANWIGQDYLSPQGVGTVLSLGIMALTMRWLYTGNRTQFGPRRRWFFRKRVPEPGQAGQPAAISPKKARKIYARLRPAAADVTAAGLGQRVAHAPVDAWERLRSADYRPAAVLGRVRGAEADGRAARPAGQEPRKAPKRPADLLVRPGRHASFLVTILLLFFVLTAVHELSPYIVAVQLVVLAAARPLRPRWLPLAMLVIAIAYLLPRLSFVENHYGLLGSLGSFFGNVAPPSADTSSYAGSIPSSQLLIQRCAEGLSVVIWLLALVGAWRLRHSGRIVLALVVLTYSPILVLFGQAYGNEGILRVYLFSLPWAAALAAAAVEPGPLARGLLPRAWLAAGAAGRGLRALTRAALLGIVAAGVAVGAAAAVAGRKLWAAARALTRATAPRAGSAAAAAGSAAATAGGKLWAVTRATVLRIGSAAVTAGWLAGRAGRKLWALIQALARATAAAAGSAAAAAGSAAAAAGSPPRPRQTEGPDPGDAVAPPRRRRGPAGTCGPGNGAAPQIGRCRHRGQAGDAGPGDPAPRRFGRCRRR